MNLIELLMMEHASLRVHFRYIKENKDQDFVYEIEDFVRNCHARVEDEIVFPKLKTLIDKSGDSETTQSLSRLEADHRLIEKIGDEIKSRTVSGEMEILRRRIMLFANTVEVHNSAEETLVFPYWKATNAFGGSSSSGDELLAKNRHIIDHFGLERYFRITGLSDKLLARIA